MSDAGPPPNHKRGQPLPCYAVIMAGGQGTRFWPRSRRRLPKHLLPIAGRSTLLQDTARRLLPLCSWRRLLVVTNSEQEDEVRRQLPRLPADQILIEPASRSTAACAALAAEWIVERVPDALMIVTPADHVIAGAAGFRRTLARASALAGRADALVTLGVRPTRPETGYGYIEMGAAIGGQAGGAHWVRRFREKPTATVARRYLGSGRHLWNVGVFVWRASVLRRALEQHLPAVRRHLEGVWAAGRDPRALARAYRGLPSVSLDVGLMQPSSVRQKRLRVAVVPADFGWSDVGSWGAVPDIWGRDHNGNVSTGKVVAVNGSDCIVYSPDRLVALVGVDNLIVVDSADALLICARDHAQEVRKVADELQRRRWSRYL